MANEVIFFYKKSGKNIHKRSFRTIISLTDANSFLGPIESFLINISGAFLKTGKKSQTKSRHPVDTANTIIFNLLGDFRERFFKENVQRKDPKWWQ